MTVRGPFAYYLMEPHPAQSPDDERSYNERDEERRNSGACGTERYVVEDAEKPEVSDERDKQVIEH
jgi:hypothetical protein